MEEVTLMQMLLAREERVYLQNQLLETLHLPIVCFTMNIPGPVKDTPLIRRSFLWGVAALDSRLPKSAVRHRAVSHAVTGSTAFYAVDLPAGTVKKICVAIEESCPMGRLFDMDVLNPDGAKLERDAYGGGSRDCIVCGKPGRGCASRRTHSVAELQSAARSLMENHFQNEDARKIGTLAVQSLLEEVCTTPKPGLVDRRNRGSHADMDIFTFQASAAALAPYFLQCASLGMETAAQPPEETFFQLRKAGLLAEQSMYGATHGVNTHKGAIFTMGLLCGAAGRLWSPEWTYAPEAVCREVGAMTASTMGTELEQAPSTTAGERLYHTSGVRGVRGEVAAGLPSVIQLGLPAFESALASTEDFNEAGVRTLLHLIARVEDTNLLHRGGGKKAARAAQRCQALSEDFSMDGVCQLDDWFIRENLSPGGCADLLAGVYFLHHLKNA